MNDDTYDDDSAGQAEESGRTRRRLRRLVPRRAELITDKRRSPAENLRHRERLYMILQLSRIPFLILAVLAFLWWENWIISTLLFVISIPMPWIAVMFANAQGEPRDRRAPQVYKPGIAREAEIQRQLAASRQAELEAAREAETIDDPGDGAFPGGNSRATDDTVAGDNIVDAQPDPAAPDTDHPGESRS